MKIARLIIHKNGGIRCLPDHEIIDSVMQRSREWDGTGFSSQRDRYYFRNQRNPNQDFDILRWNLTKVEQFMYTWLILIMRIRLTHEFHPVAVEIEGLTLMIPPCKLSSPFSNLIRIQIVLSIRVTEG